MECFNFIIVPVARRVEKEGRLVVLGHDKKDKSFHASCWLEFLPVVALLQIWCVERNTSAQNC